jgi:hypothetical protein
MKYTNSFLSSRVAARQNILRYIFPFDSIKSPTIFLIVKIVKEQNLSLAMAAQKGFISKDKLAEN